MITLQRQLKLRDLEIFQVLKGGNIITYAIIEDTRKPFTEEDKKLAPLCLKEDEDINEIVNVFRISFVHDEALTQQESMTLRTFFSDFVNTTSLTNFIIKEYTLEDLYDHDVDIEFFNKLLHNIGSSYSIEVFDERKWLYLSQD
ncbi:terpene synthase [Bacillus sp. KH172YL63]|uniref:terpene synthase n=1 Tax=Bacillus sp. KH172YL63 TaxID=2709784 RepID=UPI0013E49E21|nr:terpene synthase [Bacillus sp. KH172YL63]BCB01896.1 hypothetical protein KH172YL63_00290 [Bacillus sp. KH172YL63]